MIHKQNFNTRVTFSVMVPISVLAFLLGFPSITENLSYLTVYDYVIMPTP